MLLPLASASSSPWLSSFFGPSFTKAGNIPPLEEVLSAVLGHGFEFPSLTESTSVTQKGAQQIHFQLPESKSPQEDSLFLSELLHCYHHIPRSYSLIFFQRKDKNFVTFKKQSLIIPQLQPGIPRGNFWMQPGHTQRFLVGRIKICICAAKMQMPLWACWEHTASSNPLNNPDVWLTGVAHFVCWAHICRSDLQDVRCLWRHQPTHI